MNIAIHFSRDSDEWATPQDVFDRLNDEFRFTLDVCATAENTKHFEYYTKEANGLMQDWWRHTCWMNPPYSALRAWMEKASNSAKAGATVVCLIPSRTDTRAWHDYVWNEATNTTRPGVEIRFIKGRLKFGGSKNSAPFPSVVVIFRQSVSV